MTSRLSILSFIILLFGCQHDERVVSKIPAAPVDAQTKSSVFTIEEVEPFRDFKAFWDYYSRHIELNEDFLGYDKDHKKISKAKFLKLLSTGKYQPLQVNPADSLRYQLKSSPLRAEASIGDYMKMFAKEQSVFHRMEGRPVPEFDFKTIEGKRYTSENTKGKILLFKCWFIACVPCVQEMPELNALVEQYRSRKDIVFLSLATDDEVALKGFLKRTRFDYETVAQQDRYMTDKLNVNAYPTHVLIDKAGHIVKVADSVDQLEKFLKRML
ncbi:MAG: alkyl hydroperoxide reductase/Thiol specific antioxidant/Mal allergen [Pedobacter sp.]|jgi:peroxiredoxin|nr:alkyl hydroperoxide reductase/Thiol specific antioxidant/Mal allergen [Pedobacter sp.]